MTDDPKNQKPSPQGKTLTVSGHYSSDSKDISGIALIAKEGVKTSITVFTPAKGPEVKNVTIRQSSTNDWAIIEGSNHTIDQGAGNDTLQFGPDEITEGGSVAGKYVSKNAKVTQGAGNDTLDLLDNNGGVTGSVFDGGEGTDKAQLVCLDPTVTTITRTAGGLVIQNNATKLPKFYQGYAKPSSNLFKNYETMEFSGMSGTITLDLKELAALPLGKPVSVAEADLSNAAKTPSVKPEKPPVKSH